MTDAIPTEVDWDTAPNLLDGAMSLTLTPQDCNLRYWLQSVPQGTLRGRIDGHAPGLEIPEYMRKPGPLYDAITTEYAFRTMAEEKAARVLAYLVPIAPDIDSMEFYVTQVLDETRHAMVFRGHLAELGVARERLVDAMEEFAGADRQTILRATGELRPGRDAGQARFPRWRDCDHGHHRGCAGPFRGAFRTQMADA